MQFQLSHMNPEIPADRLYPDLPLAQREAAIKLDAIICTALAGTDTVHVPDELIPGMTKHIAYLVAARIGIAIRLKCKFVPDQS